MKFVGSINRYARDTMDVNNLGLIDTLARAAVTLGIVLYLLMAVGTMTMGLALLAMASILIGATAACRWDPVYHLLGWNSNEERIAAWLRGAPHAADEAVVDSEHGKVVTIDLPGSGEAANNPDRPKAA